jgi:hypothetical protein
MQGRDRDSRMRITSSTSPRGGRLGYQTGVGTAPSPPTGDKLLLVSGDDLLLVTGDSLLRVES